MEQKTNSTQCNIPNLCETDGIPFDEKQIHQIWIIPSVNFVWCIAEIDIKTNEAFGYANLNDDQMAEWGYIDINDIRKNGAKLIHCPAMPFKKALEIVRPKNGCPKCSSDQYGYHTIKRGDPTLTDDMFDLWICRNCNYQPFTNIRGLV